MVSIAGYIAATAALPFRWSDRHCALWCADLAVARGHRDPAEGWRDGFDGAFAARRAVMLAGGLAALCRGQMVGFPPGERANGICLAQAQGQTICGILSGGRLVLKTPRGIVLPPVWTVIEGWTI